VGLLQIRRFAPHTGRLAARAAHVRRRNSRLPTPYSPLPTPLPICLFAYLPISLFARPADLPPLIFKEFSFQISNLTAFDYILQVPTILKTEKT